MRGRNCDISPGNTINNDYQFHTQAIIIGAVGSLIDNSVFFWISDGLKAYSLVWIGWNNVEVY